VIEVDGIVAGSARRSGRNAEFSQRVPGLAVDPRRRRAFVVAAGGDVAEVRLATGAVTHHRLSQRGSYVASSEPAAADKSLEGPERVAGREHVELRARASAATRTRGLRP
jgi:hypothetical protein